MVIYDYFVIAQAAFHMGPTWVQLRPILESCLVGAVIILGLWGQGFINYHKIIILNKLKSQPAVICGRVSLEPRQQAIAHLNCNLNVMADSIRLLAKVLA